MHVSSSTVGALTRGLTGKASMSSGGNGTRRDASDSPSRSSGSSHWLYAAGGMITGIRSWIGARTAFAAVVRIHPNVVRLFPAVLPLPLVETAGGDQAAMSSERIAEGWFFLSCFGASVDEAVAERRVLRPGRNQTPAEKGDLASASGGGSTHGRDMLGWSDIVARQ
jgi:hypothetical protein